MAKIWGDYIYIGPHPRIAERDNPRIIRAVISGELPPPIKYAKSSRTIAREKEKAERAAREAAAAVTLAKSVVRSMRPPAGRLWAVDAAALLLIGPGGAIPVTGAQVAALGPYAAGGRHPETDRVREASQGLAPRLAAVGLRIDRRKAGVRIAKLAQGHGPDRAKGPTLAG